MKNSIGRKRQRGLLQPQLLWIFRCLALIILGCLPYSPALGQSFRAATSASAASGVTTLTINKPAGAAYNDVLIAAISITPSSATINPPAGWTLVRRTNQGSVTTNSQATYRKVVGNSEPSSYAWTFSASQGSAGGVMAFYNVSTTTPVHQESFGATASALTHAAPSLITTVANTMLVATHSFASSATWTPPTGMTEAIDAASLTPNNASGVSLEMSYALMAGTGASGAKTATASALADAGVGQLIALRSLGCSTPSAPTVTTPVNYCQNATATQLTATGSNLVWGISGGTTSGSVGGTGTLPNTTWVDNTWNNQKTEFTTNANNVTITTVKYQIPAWQAVNGLRLSIYNSSGTVIATSSTITTNTAAGTLTTITNTFNYTITTAGNYSIGVSAGSGNIGGDSPSYPLTESTGAINVTGHDLSYRCFNDIQFTVDPSSIAPTPSTASIGTTNYLVARTVSGCLSPQATIAVVVAAAPIATFSYTGTPYCSNGSDPSPTYSGGGAAGTFSASPAGLVFISTATGQVDVSASTPGSYTVTNTRVAAGGCAQVQASSPITVTAVPVATFSYTATPYCANASDPSPTYSGGGAAGTFSASPAGLVFISTATGQVDVSASTPGSYTVTNTRVAAGGCAQVQASSPITVTAVPVATFSYTATPYCANASDPSPTYSGGGAAGTFSASPAGLVFISTATGQVDVSASTPGSYTVTNTRVAAGGCAQVQASSPITVTAVPVATFSYTATPYCANASDPSPTYSGGGAAGTFSASPAGLVFISTATGQVDVSASTPGSYTVTNTRVAAGGCAQVQASSPITITAVPVATFSYTATPYCANASDPSPTYSGGGAAGTFSASPAGLVFISTATGQVDVSASTPGSYTVTNTRVAAGGCAQVQASSPITITAVPVATFSYTATPYCANASDPSPTYSGGGAAGTFSASPAGLVFVSTATGQVDVSASTPGSYTVTNTIAATSGCAQVQANSSIMVTAVPVATFSYTATPYCANASDPSPTYSGGGAAGTFSASPAGLVFISTATGQVDVSASTPGSYTVTNTIAAANGCAQVQASSPITITAVPVATFSYTGSPYCQNAANPSPTFSGGGVAGTFSSTAGLVFVSTATGEVDLAASTPGLYSVTNTIAAANGCAQVTSNSSITITAAPSATISYAGSPYGPSGTATVTFSGTAGGSYSSTAGLSINSSTGDINLGASAIGTYIVTYTVAASGGCSLYTTTTSVTISDNVLVTATGGTTSATYSRLGLATAAINAGTHTGTITVTILGNTTETVPCVLNSSGAGSASYTSILIQPGADGLTVAGPTTTGRGLIELNGADNITIDGDNPNTPGTNRNLTFQNTAASTITYTSVIRLALSTLITTTDDNTVKNCNLIGSAVSVSSQASTSQSAYTTYGIVASGRASTSSATAAPSTVNSVTLTTGATATLSNFTVTNNSIYSVGRGISINGNASTVATGLLINNNDIGQATSTNSIYVFGIAAQGSSNGVISGNTVLNVESSSPAAISGIDIGTASSVAADLFTIEKNTVRQVFNSNIGTYGAYGINITGGTGNVIQNNFVIDVKNDQSFSAGSFTTALGAFGIRLNSTDNHKVYHNSVHLYGALTGSAMTDLTAAFAITATGVQGIDVQNNIFSNVMSGGSSTGTRHAVLYLPSGGTSAMNLTINNNFYYQGATGLHILAQVGTTVGTGEYVNTDFVAATTSPSTNLRAYTSTLSGAGTNDDASVAAISLPLPFTSNTDLHIPTGSNNPLESSGATIASVTDDIDGHTRPGPAGSVNGGGSAPDIGADEYDGLMFIAPPTIVYTALSNCGTANRTFSVTISDALGVPTSGGNMPRVWFRKNAGSWFSQAGTLTAGSGTNGTWSFTIVSATMGGLTNGDVVSYYVVAQNANGLVSTNPTVSFSSGLPANVNTIAGTPAFNTYSIANTSGTFTVGVGQQYTTITDAVNDYNNNSCLSGAIILSLTDASYPSEVFPITINNNPQASATNTLTIQPAAGVASTVSATTAVSIFKLLNAQYITIDGLNSGGSSLTLTNNQNSSGRSVIWLASTASTGPGCGNITLKNLAINGPSNSSGRYAIIAGVDGATPATTAGADNDNITIQNNAIERSYYGIYARGTAATSSGGLDNWVISGNTIGPAAYSATNNIGFNGLYLYGMLNLNVSNNTIQNVGLTTLTGNTIGGIFLATNINGALIENNSISGIISNATATGANATMGIGLSSTVINTKISKNTISDVSNVSATGYGPRGIIINTGTANSYDTIVNNMISNIYGYAEVTNTRWPIGIDIEGSSGRVNIWHNSVHLYGSQTGTNTASGSAAMFINSTGTNLDIRNNIFVNTYDNVTSSTDKGWAMYSTQSGTAQYSFNNYNDYYVATPNVLGFRTSDRVTITDMQTGFGGNTLSYNVNPSFTSSTDLHIPAATTSALESSGASIGITTDIDGDTRPGPAGSVNGGGTAPDIGADEFDAIPQDVFPPSISYATLSNSCNTGNRTLTATIADALSGVATGANLPRIYYKRTTDPSWFSQAGSLTAGTVFNGTYSFTIVSADMVGLVSGEVVEYFVAAQDVAGNVGAEPLPGFSATDVNTISSYPSTPNTYTVTVVVASITAQTNVTCNGAATGSLTVTPSGGATPYSFSWSPSGGTAATASSLVAGTYTVTVTDNLGCTATTSAVITQAPVAGTWTGTLSTNWHTAGNWLCNAVPVGIDVIIPTGLSTYPVISSATADVDDLTIGAGASITVSTSLEISGNITNSGSINAISGAIEMNGSGVQTIPANLFISNEVMDLTVNNAAGVVLAGVLNLSGVLLLASGDLTSNGNLMLLSTAAQTALIDGNGTGDVIGSATMQRYLPSGFGYKYVSSPFQSSTVSEFANDLNLAASFPTFYRYDENLLSNGWVNYTTSSNSLNLLEGYAANFGNLSNPKTVDMSGLVNNGAVINSSLFNHNRTFTQGFNLAGNPYPSPIDWDSPVGWTRTNIDDAVYYFDNGSLDQYTGTYSSYINGVSSNGIANSIIPSMQGFFIHVTNGSYPVSGSIDIDNTARVNNLTPVFHKTTANQYPLVRLGVNFDKEDTTTDNLVVYFSPDASGAFEPTMDALKLDNTNTEMPGLSARSTDGMRLSINALPAPGDTDRIVPLSLKLEKGGNVRFSMRTMEFFPYDLHVHLLDMMNKTTQDLTINPMVQVPLTQGTTDSRFYLVFSKKTQVDELMTGPVLNVYTSNGKLFVGINLLTGDGGELVVRNMLGQSVWQGKLQGFGNHEIPLPSANGIYVVSYAGRTGVYTRKIVLNR